MPWLEDQSPDINIYSTYGDCYSDSVTQPAPKGSFFNYTTRWSSAAGNIGRVLAKRPTHPAVVAGLGLQKVGGMVPCIDSDGGSTYLNRDDVKAALHVSESPLTWALCSSVLQYHSTFGQDSMIPIYQALRGRYRMLVYNGDTDGCVNFMGSQDCVAAVGSPLLDEKDDWRAWHYTDAAGPQVAGFVTEYRDNLAFLTVRGAGHSALASPLPLTLLALPDPDHGLCRSGASVEACPCPGYGQDLPRWRKIRIGACHRARHNAMHASILYNMAQINGCMQWIINYHGPGRRFRSAQY